MVVKSMKNHAFIVSVLGAVLAVWPWAPALASPVSELRAVAVVADDSGAAVSLNLSARVAYRVVAAQKPTRVALTLRHVRAASDLVMPRPLGIITGVTSQAQANGDLRLTIFLAPVIAAATGLGQFRHDGADPAGAP